MIVSIDDDVVRDEGQRLDSTANWFAAAEELSEEDQQLKNELDMLVERLTVSLPYDSCHPAAARHPGSAMDVSELTKPVLLGIRCNTVQACVGGHEDIHQDLDILHDRRPQASEVPQAALRDHDETLRNLARGR